MLILIGGGDLKSKSTKKIDDFIIKSSNKAKPNVLFVPTASMDKDKSIENFKISYEAISNIKVLLLYSEISNEKIDEMINWADIIYVGGGNTLRMLQKWDEKDIGKKIFNSKKIIAGISAGAICWFDYYLGDDEAFYDNGYCNFKIRKGLGLINGICCPHYDEDGKDIFNSIMKKYNYYGYAIENNAALVIDNNKMYSVCERKKSVYIFKPYNTIMEELK